jgi:outer membrane protein TolC
VRTRHGIELSVKNAYFGLVLALNSREVISASLEAAKTAREQAKNFLDRGMIQTSDYLMADVRYLELGIKKIEARDAARDAGDRLRILLGLPDSVTITPTDTLSLLTVGDTSYDPGRVFATRSDMVAIRNGIDAASAGVRMHQSGWIPSLNAFGSYELNNEHLAGATARNWTVGAVVSWTIFSGFDRIGEIQKASAKRSELETKYQHMKAEGSREIASALRALESSRMRIEMASRAVEQAAESYRVIADRYEAGLERTTDLLQSDASLLNARLSYLQALYQHSASVFMLEFLLERKVTQ